ncbi:MAG: SDR family NAD(P)-dependent oxidoreductase, partial [Candidatus Nitrosotenuis sp.]|nr:SDR family NAD(P)-dependent oxidoreductase [Candidatus Nitrosotenuis sp.]
MQKIALVTGSSNGIGLETALALAKEGYHTYASMRDTKKAAELLNSAKKEGLELSIIQLDVDKEESVKSAISQIMSEKQRIDVLVNNAGYGIFGCLEDLTLDEMRQQFETNFFAIARLIQTVSP